MISRRDLLRGGALLGAGLVLAACSGGGGQRLQAPGQGTGRNDVNPQPRDAVRDGGDLRWPIDYLPSNFNANQFDGADLIGVNILGAVLPTPFVGTADAGLRLNTDLLVSAELTSPSPQVVRYVIHPKAAWSDGTPITWRDFEAQWKAMSGANPAFQVASRTGYEDIASVARGDDDKQVVVTFARTFAEWQSLFGPLYPASTNTDPATFNTGWIEKIPVTAGPFTVDGIDSTTETVTLKRDPRWWGSPAKLDRIIFRRYERTALADGLANNEIDFYFIGSSVDLHRRAQGIPGVVVRQAPERQYNQITFNGAPGAILADPALRRAIAKGIDRTDIARRLVGQIVPGVSQLGNHIYPFGSKNYRDNSGVVAFDRDAANRELDGLGWVRPPNDPNGVRVKDGRPLRVRQVGDASNPIGDLIDKTVSAQLAAIGVGTDMIRLDSQQKNTAIKSGDFDLIGFVWQSTATPFSSARGLYAEPKGNDVQQNYGRIFDPEITALFDQGIRELDEAKRAELGNRIDELIWREVHHLPLYPATGAYAVRSTLANFGAAGFADIDYVNAGFAK